MSISKTPSSIRIKALDTKCRITLGLQVLTLRVFRFFFFLPDAHDVCSEEPSGGQSKLATENPFVFND